MAVHKVPQDVEAEDKFLGPLTFKQFIFLGGAGISGYVIYLMLVKELWFLSAIVFIPFLFFAVLAFPWSKDQPTELWLASRIRFMLVPHRRVWDQSGVKDLVQITVPKREVHVYSDGLTQDQVRTRLNTLASVVDTRGWAVKNLNMSTTNTQNNSDRLVPLTPITPSNAQAIVSSANDMMDVQANPVAQQFDSMIQQSEQKHRQDTLAMIQAARQEVKAPVASPQMPSLPQAMPQNTPTPMAPASSGQTPSTTVQAIQRARSSSAATNNATPAGPATPYTWDVDKKSDPMLTAFQDNVVVAPGENQTSRTMGMGVPVNQGPAIQKEDEDKLLEHVKQKKRQDADFLKHSHQKVIRPLSEQTDSNSTESQAPEQTPGPFASFATNSPQTPSTPPVDPAILALADNDDLNVATLARQAKRDMPDEGEVIISLH